jgi:hypothetical protein
MQHHILSKLAGECDPVTRQSRPAEANWLSLLTSAS